VGRLADGRRVYFDTVRAPYGAMAEQTLVAPETLLDVPDGIDDAVAAAMGNCGLAAWLALSRRAGLRPGERVLVLGATGAVGAVAVQSAQVLGAGRVVAVSRLGEAVPGADAVVALETDEHAAVTGGGGTFARGLDDLAGAFRAAAGGGVDVIIDLLWGAPAMAAMRAAAHGARHIQIGQLAGVTAELAAPVVRSAALDLRGFAIFHEPIEARREAYVALGAAVEAGNVVFSLETHPLAEVQVAWERQRAGAKAKLILKP
jgi:NADPH2:quinone reductase